MKNNNSAKHGFTIVEVLVVLGILIVLVVVALFFLNPSQLASQGRDSNRLSDLTLLNESISLYHEAKPGGSLGTSGIIYISIPDLAATSTAGTDCSSLGLPALSSGTYHCAASSTYRNIDGTGWLPINFSTLVGRSFSTLPVDPVNTTSSKEYYVYVASGTQYEVLANPEAQKILTNATSSFTQGNSYAILSAFPGSSSASATQHLWVMEFSNTSTYNRIDEFDLNGNYIANPNLTGAGSPNGTFSYLRAMALDSSGNIYVADQQNVEKFSSSGTYLAHFGSYGSGLGQYQYPTAVAVDKTAGDVYVLDWNDRIERYSASDTALTAIGSPGTSTGQFSSYPWGMAVDASGNIWATDSANNRVEEFNYQGTAEFQSSGTVNHPLVSPSGIAVDSAGNLFVTNYNTQNGINPILQKYTNGFGDSVTIASTGTSTGQLSPSFYGGGVAVDASGNIWVADYANNRVEEFGPSGNYIKTVTTGHLFASFNPADVVIQ